MIKNYYILLFISAMALTVANAQTHESTVLFNDDWRFFRGGAQGADNASFDDSQWRKLDLPHDWSIEDLPGKNSPFDRGAIGQASVAFTTGGTGWYRKTFVIPADQKGKLIRFRFDGVYMNADVWVNGKRLARQPYGYTTFNFDATKNIRFGDTNVIPVKVRNQGENSRWYAGSGIYRHVWLTTVDPVNVIPFGHYVTTPEVSAASSRVNLKTKVKNETDAEVPVTLVTRLLDGKGAQVAIAESRQSIGAGKMVEFNQDLVVKGAALWSPESPSLYKAVSEVLRSGQPAGKAETSFGIRSISFDAVRGFLLNGKPVKLRGGCIHHDNGPLGARAYDRAEERKIGLLKANGFNAVRTAHNPPSPSLLNACDRLGMMVIDEAFDIWKNGKSTDDYHLLFEEWWQKDLESLVLRDRNHPSIFMWSTGNEIPGRDKPEVVAVAKQLRDFIKTLDTTRPVTAGVNGVAENLDPFISTLDVAGYNYAPDRYVPDHKRLPGRVMYSSESFALDAFEYWMAVQDNPWVIGDFVWTAFDYIGEASLGWRGYIQDQNFFPWTLAYSGDIDICGWKRPQSYYRDVLWKKDQISLFVTPPKPSIEGDPVRLPNMRWHWLDEVADWNWDGQDNKPLGVNVYSDCEQVELFLNGKSLGRKPSNRSTKFTASWQVPYQPGALKAVGYRGKKQVTVAELKTAAQPSVIRLLADRKQLAADGQDLLYVTVELTDANGVLHPKAEDLVKFAVEGPATIEGVGNANPVSIESYQLPQRKAWRGRCMVVLKTGRQPGKITLKVSAEGMKASQVEVESMK